MHTRFSKTWLIGRIINLTTYLVAATYAGFTASRPDVVVVETDPPLLCLLGGWLQWWHKCQLVVYLQDIYPDVAVVLGKMRNGWLAAVLRKRILRVYLKADRIVVLSDDMRSLLMEWGLPGDRVAKIPNWVDTAAILPAKTNNRFRAANDLENRFVVMYSGNMGLCQHLDSILFAAKRLVDRSDIHFVLIGQGVLKTRLERFARDHQLKNVEFFDYQPKKELSSSLSAADVHLVPVDGRLIRFLMPSKLYGILASGTALIASAPEDCELSRLVADEDVGLVAPPADDAALADLIRQCADDRPRLERMGRRARELAVTRYDREISTRSFAHLLVDLTLDRETAASSNDELHELSRAETVTVDRIA